MDVISTAIGIGLAISLLFSELFGLAAGGMVVPGYLAVSLNQPLNVALTMLAAIVTWGIVHALSSFVIVYGKRRTVLMILFGFLVGMVIRSFSWHLPDLVETAGNLSEHHSAEISSIGYIIPGLLAIWIDRQGLVETLCVCLTAAVAVRLVLITCGVSLV